MTQKENSSVSLVITSRYRHLIRFSLVGLRGLYEIEKMYIEVVKIFRCVPSGTLIEATSVPTNYSITIVPNFKIYPLFPPTVTNTQDAWVLKGDDIDLFGIEFDWPYMSCVEAVIRAEGYNHTQGGKFYISSGLFTLCRNGEVPTDVSFIPQNAQLSLSPYLHKLLTIDDFISNVVRECQLNNQAYAEIASVFSFDSEQLKYFLHENADCSDLAFESSIHPAIAVQLLEVAKGLQNHLSTMSDPSNTHNTFNFNAQVGIVNTHKVTVTGNQVGVQNVSDKSLVEAAIEIRKLLDHLVETYPTSTEAEKKLLVSEALNRIRNQPTLKERAWGALKAGSFEVIKAIANHPAVSVTVEIVRGWIEAEPIISEED